MTGTEVRGSRPRASAGAAPPGRRGETAGRGGRAARLLPLAAPLFYLVLAALFLTPLLRNFDSAVIAATTEDMWQNLWWLWWAREALTHGRSPYFTDRIYHPFGAPVFGLDTVAALLAVPLQSLFGLVTTFNLLILVAMALGAYAMYLLALDVTGSRGGALVAGAVFGFAPQQSSAVNAGQLEHISVGFVPLTILFLLRLRHDGRRRTIVCGALGLALATLTSPYHTLSLAIFALLYAGYYSVGPARRRDWPALRRFWSRLLAWGALALVLMAPLLLVALAQTRATPLPTAALATFSYRAVDLSKLWRPNPLHPLWGADRLPLSYALGWAATALALLGVWRLRRRAVFWVATFAVFFLFSLGPHLVLSEDRWIELPFLPYNLLYRLPLARIGRAPTRFVLFLNLAEAVLAAGGVVWLGARLARRRPARAGAARALVTALALALVLAEWLPLPRVVTAATLHPFYRTLAAGPPGAVREVPYDARALAMYAQTVHGRPLIGGYATRPLDYPLQDRVPLLRHLRTRAHDGLSDLARPDIFDQPSPLARGLDLFDAYGIRYVVLRKTFLADGGDRAELIKAVEAVLPGSAIVWDDAELRAYLIPPRDGTGIIADCVSGWYSLDTRDDTGQRFRWSDGDALLSLSLLDREPRTVTLTATTFSFHQPVTVDVSFNGAPLATLTVGMAAQPLAFELPLRHGYNELRFRSREAPLRPSELSGARDSRALSVALADVRLTPP
jgi:hypothetical protein